MLLHDLWRKRPLAVARDVDLDLAHLGQNRLRAAAISGVAFVGAGAGWLCGGFACAGADRSIGALRVCRHESPNRPSSSQTNLEPRAQRP
jgi:hypothetical protein